MPPRMATGCVIRYHTEGGNMESSALLTAILLFLFAAVVTVPIARRLGIGMGGVAHVGGRRRAALAGAVVGQR